MNYLKLLLIYHKNNKLSEPNFFKEQLNIEDDDFKIIYNSFDYGQLFYI